MAPKENALNQSLESLAEPICRAHGVELVDIRFNSGRAGGVVRVLIDRFREGEEVGSGVSLADCTAVSRDLSAALDAHDDLVPGNYRLEVGSPGLERPLFKLRDFERFTGKEVALKTYAPIGRRRRFSGQLRRVVDEHIEIDQDGQTVCIPFAEIAQANLVYRFR